MDDTALDYCHSTKISRNNVRSIERKYLQIHLPSVSYASTLLICLACFECVKAQDPDDGNSGSEEEDSGGVDWATILSNPQNLAILFGFFMFILVVIYCLWQKIMACIYFIWNSFCRVPCCLTCKWCCVPCYKGTRNMIAGCKDSFYEGYVISPICPLLFSIVRNSL